MLAANLKNRELVHAETSSDADSWRERLVRIERKFRMAEAHYLTVFGVEFSAPKRIALVGARAPKMEVKLEGIDIVSIDALMRQIKRYLGDFDPMKDAVPEGYGYLRAIPVRALVRTSKHESDVMDTDSINRHLRQLYSASWPALVAAIPSGESYSVPLLLQVGSDYPTADVRMMVVGQQTNTWWHSWDDLGRLAAEGKDPKPRPRRSLALQATSPRPCGLHQGPGFYWGHIPCVTERAHADPVTIKCWSENCTSSALPAR